MVNFFLLAGGYSSTIITYLFNSTASTLSLTSTANVGINPSWLAKHTTNPSIIYATNEIDQGALQSFTVDKNGVLSAAVDTIATGGASPAHAAHLGRGKVAVMNYSGGNGRIVTTAADGLHFDQASYQQISFAPAGVVSHPHQAVLVGNEVFVPDLGQDKIFRLSLDGKIQGSIEQPAGSGPRHIAIADNRLYTLHELDNTLTLQTIPALNATGSPILSSVSIIPSPVPAGAKYGAAEILIPAATRAFPKRYIYVSNRNIGTPTAEGDSIAIYERVVSGGKESLSLVKQVFTGILQPRGLEFVTAPNGDEYLAVGGVAGTGGIAIFQRTEGGRNLKEVARNTQVATRTSFVWL